MQDLVAGDKQSTMENVCEKCSQADILIHATVKSGHDQCLRATLAAGADVNTFSTRELYGKALMTAAEEGYDKCVAML